MKVFQASVEMKRSYKQYESDTTGLQVHLESGDNVSEVLGLMKRACLGEDVPELVAGQSTAEPASAPVAKEVPKKEAPKAKENPAAKKKPVEEPAKKEETPAAKKEEEPAKTPAKKEEEPKAKEEKKAPAKKKAAPKKSKALPYDRMNDLHKKHMGQLLDGISPDWRKKHMDKAVAASKGLNGTDFMDSKGEILDSFKESLKELMS